MAAKSKQTIAKEIEKRVLSVKPKKYNVWRIGITHTPNKRKKEWADEGHNVDYWTQWQATSLKSAQEIETFFLNDYPKKKEERMDGGTGGNMDAKYITYVYIY